MSDAFSSLCFYCVTYCTFVTLVTPVWASAILVGFFGPELTHPIPEGAPSRVPPLVSRFVACKVCIGCSPVPLTLFIGGVVAIEASGRGSNHKTAAHQWLCRVRSPIDITDHISSTMASPATDIMGDSSVEDVAAIDGGTRFTTLNLCIIGEFQRMKSPDQIIELLSCVSLVHHHVDRHLLCVSHFVKEILEGNRPPMMSLSRNVMMSFCRTLISL